MEQACPEISVVIPVYNELPNLDELLKRTVATMESLGRSFEILAVDDGSSDGTFEAMRAFREQDPRLRVVRLARNYGQTPALYAGFANVRGRLIVTLDADLQNPPEELTKIVATLDEGHDVVFGWREDRHDSLFRRGASKILNRIVSWLIGARIRDLGCGLKGLTRECVDRLNQLTHQSRYLPAEIMWLGVDLAEVRVDHRPRERGSSKYNIFDLLRLNFTIISSISTAPVKIVGAMGWLFSLAGFFMGIRIFLMRLWYGHYSDLASVTAIFFILAGIQLIATGMMCEYIARIFTEVQRKPYFTIREVLE